MYHAMVWLMYGVKVTGSTARSANPAARTSPVSVAPSTGSSVVSRPVASSSARIVGAAADAQGSLES